MALSCLFKLAEKKNNLKAVLGKRKHFAYGKKEQWDKTTIEPVGDMHK